MEYEIYKSGPRKGQCKTIRDRLIRYYTEYRGCSIMSRSGKSVRLSYPPQAGYSIYLGSHGSCRLGKNKTGSTDISDTAMKHMIKWENEKGLPIG